MSKPLLLEMAADFQQATLRQSIAALVMLWLTPLKTCNTIDLRCVRLIVQ